MKAPFRDGVGKLPPSHAFPGGAGRVLLCPRDTSVPFVPSVWDWDRPLFIAWTSHLEPCDSLLFPSRVLTPKDIRMSLSIPRSL